MGYVGKKIYRGERKVIKKRGKRREGEEQKGFNKLKIQIIHKVNPF
jgi:hypothetical protein